MSTDVVTNVGVLHVVYNRPLRCLPRRIDRQAGGIWTWIGNTMVCRCGLPEGARAGQRKDVESGRRSDRPVLEQALAMARVHRVPLSSLRWKVDRLTSSVALLSRLLESGVEAGFADLPAIEGPASRRLPGERLRQPFCETRRCQTHAVASNSEPPLWTTFLGYVCVVVFSFSMAWDLLALSSSNPCFSLERARSVGIIVGTISIVERAIEHFQCIMNPFPRRPSATARAVARCVRFVDSPPGVRFAPEAASRRCRRSIPTDGEHYLI